MENGFRLKIKSSKILPKRYNRFPMKSFIKEVRKNLSKSQSQFARSAGITQPMVSMLEKGKAPLTPGMAKKISQSKRLKLNAWQREVFQAIARAQ